MRTLITTVALILALPAAALADGRDVLRDCGDDERLSKRYTQQEYREALGDIDADTEQYTNCSDVIRRAQLAALGGGGGGGGNDTSGAVPGGGDTSGGDTGGGAPVDPLADATPEERAAVDDVVKGGSAPVALGGVRVDPAKAGRVPNVSSVGDLPTPLLILLALLAVGALAYATTRVRTIVVARRAA